MDYASYNALSGLTAGAGVAAGQAASAANETNKQLQNMSIRQQNIEDCVKSIHRSLPIVQNNIYCEIQNNANIINNTIKQNIDQTTQNAINIQKNAQAIAQTNKGIKEVQENHEVLMRELAAAKAELKEIKEMLRQQAILLSQK